MRFLALCLLVFLAGPGARGDRVTLVVLNKAEASVSLIDPVTGETRKTLKVGVGPHEAATSPDGRYVIVCNYGDRSGPGSSLSVLDMEAQRVTATIDLTPYHRPHGIQFLPNGRRVVVTAE